ncbi:ABC transporter permease [Nocardioides sp. Kera G14]|uniref:ABC transporter permease n=1 Tax=Nocardioides sp. Kera G14 TaxID=2884264 RepID=UPI001D128BC3|nr:ABC transporter permease subunit [Nocardioides sp. Kera G14]UDY24303.1 ABC transporter permease subunit [Nocardioides sp. Kera G14]
MSFVWVRTRAVAFALLGILAFVGVWEGYKAIGPEEGAKVGDSGVIVLPRTQDKFMPHVSTMVQTLSKPVNRLIPDVTYGGEVVKASLFTLKLSAIGWLIGVVIGFLLAIIMSRSRLAEAALSPWVIISQTIPLVAIAPVTLSWGKYLKTGSWAWGAEQTMIVIAAYLAFFPVAVGALRGLRSTESSQLELMHVYGVGWLRTLVKLQLPASVPYLLPALRLAASSAVVGAIISEMSTGQGQGIGRLISYYSQNVTDVSAGKPWTAVFGAVAVGLVAVGLTSLLGLLLKRYRRGETA